MPNRHKEVELCIGDFKKNVRVIGGGASGKNISGSGDELNCSNAQCCIEFNASEEESNDLINKYYLGTTFPIEAYLEKYMGTGFVMKGNGKFIDAGEEFDRMKEEFPFLTRVLEVTVTSFKQSI